MQVTFCDLCNESIPFGDLERGRAVRRGGRAVCARCEQAMGGDAGRAPGALEPARPGDPARRPEPPPPARPATLAREGGRGAGTALLLAVLALVFALASSFYLLRETERSAQDLSGLRAEMQGEMTRSSDELLAKVDERVQEAVWRADAAKGELQGVVLRLDDALAAHDQALAGLQQELGALARRVEARESEPSQKSGAAFGEDLGRLERDVAELRREVGRVTAQLETEAAAGGESTDPAGPSKPLWWPHVQGLQSSGSGERWTAVQALGQTKDPAVAEHLVPVLRDPDLFVRMAACRVLGELRAVRAIPALIDALEDAEPSVREQAIAALRAASGQDLRFDPSAAPGERAKRVAEWRAWWSGAKDGLLGG